MNKKTIIAITGIVALLAVILAVRSVRGPRRIMPGGASALVTQAKRSESGGNLVSAKQAYQKLVSDFPNARDVSEWQKKIEAINIQLIFSPALTPGSIGYEIKPGDSLEKIARDHKTTAELLAKSNGLAATETIYPGRKIKVWIAPFSIVIDKSQNILLLKTGEEVFKTYVVATGTNNSTPTGIFSIVEKIVNPPWYKPGGGLVPAGSPENILGTRWLGIDKPGYGIHGTIDPSSLGKQTTAGCVRMSNQDVEQLFGIVPKGSEVTIVD